MNVYLAASLRERARAKTLRAQIEARGHAVVASWIDKDDDVTDRHLTPEQADAVAWTCQRDMEACEACVVLMSPGIRGALVELGYMVGKGLPTIAVGARPFPTPLCALAPTIITTDAEVPDALDALPQPLTGAEFIATLERVRARLAAMGVALMPEDLE